MTTFQYFSEGSLNPHASPQEGAHFLINRVAKGNLKSHLCTGPSLRTPEPRDNEHLHSYVGQTLFTRIISWNSNNSSVRVGRVKSTNLILKMRKHTQRQSDFPKGKEDDVRAQPWTNAFWFPNPIHIFFSSLQKHNQNPYLNHSVPPSIRSAYCEQRLTHCGDPGASACLCSAKAFCFLSVC